MLGAEQQEVKENLVGVKHIIAIHSGKGGVGKTFFAINLAYGFAKLGKRVGILDADIDCPNVPKFLGIATTITLGKQQRMSAYPVAGILIMSSAFLHEDEVSPFIIRGPIKHQLLRDFLAKTSWGALDYLIIDLPPGTSDVPLSVYQFLSGVSVILVSTPQKEAIMDTMKSAILAKQSLATILGFVENMSGTIFGVEKVDQIAKGLSIPVLAHIPLLQSIAELSESKQPALVNDEMLWKELMQPLLEKIIAALKK